MFESNFPVDRWGAPYGTVWNALKLVARRMGLSRAETEALCFGTATRVYKLGALGLQ
jgi:L-fuconolactonase